MINNICVEIISTALPTDINSMQYKPSPQWESNPHLQIGNLVFCH